jgi:hypothetical protein
MKVGDFIRPVRANNGHNYAIGQKYVIIAQGFQIGYWICRDPVTQWQGNNIMEADMVLWSITKADIEKNLKNLETDLYRQKMMLEYLTAENADELDNSAFFAWYLVKLIDSDEPQKKEKIAKLLNTMTNSINIDLISQH